MGRNETKWDLHGQLIEKYPKEGCDETIHQENYNSTSNYKIPKHLIQ